MVRAGWEGWWRSLTDFFSTAILRVVRDRGGFEEKIYVQGLGESGGWRRLRSTVRKAIRPRVVENLVEGLYILLHSE